MNVAGVALVGHGVLVADYRLRSKDAAQRSIRRDANAEVERIGDAPEPGDLRGTERVADPDYRVEVVERGNESTGPTGTRRAS